MPKLEWRDPPSRKGSKKGVWEDVLNELIKRPGRWAMIYRADTDEQAQQRASNLSQGLVRIPRPDDDWSFISRENEVFAIYRGKKKRESVRRTQRGR